MYGNANILRVLAMVCIAAFTASAQAADKGKLLARIGDVKLYEPDIMPDFPGAESLPAEQRAQFLANALEQAIETEVLFAVATQQGLGRDVEYLERLEQDRRLTKQREIEMLASFYEQQQKSLVEARNRAAITDEEVDLFYKENGARYQKRPEKRAKMMIRSQLAGMKHRVAYQEWLKTELAEVDIAINGSKIDAETLARSIDWNLGGAGSKAGRGVIDPLWEKIFEIAKISIPKSANSDGSSKKTAGQDGAVYAELEANLAAIKLQVGAHELAVSDLYQFDRIVTSVSNGRPDSSVLVVIKLYGVSERAKAAGIESDAGYLMAVKNVNSVHGNVKGISHEKRMLATKLIQKEGLMDYSRYEITDAETDAFLKEKGEPYQRMIDKGGDVERVRKLIQNILKGQKAQEAKKQHVLSLYETADVELFD